MPDSLEERFSKLTDLFSIDDAAFQKFFRFVDEDTISVFAELFPKGTLEDFQIDLIGEVAFE